GGGGGGGGGRRGGVVVGTVPDVGQMPRRRNGNAARAGHRPGRQGGDRRIPRRIGAVDVEGHQEGLRAAHEEHHRRADRHRAAGGRKERHADAHAQRVGGAGLPLLNRSSEEVVDGSRHYARRDHAARLRELGFQGATQRGGTGPVHRIGQGAAGAGGHSGPAEPSYA